MTHLLPINYLNKKLLRTFGIVLLTLGVALTLQAQPSEPAPDRTEGEGPYDRLIIRGVNIIDGTGGPMSGPMDIVIEGLHQNSMVGKEDMDDRRSYSDMLGSMLGSMDDLDDFEDFDQ